MVSYCPTLVFRVVVYFGKVLLFGLVVGCSGTASVLSVCLRKGLKPTVGGTICGLAAVAYPQTIFAGYTVLYDLLAGKPHLSLELLVLLLGLKLVLSSVSVASGLVGGVFAPSLFFGAVAGTAYHQTLSVGVDCLTALVRETGGTTAYVDDLTGFLAIDSANAYATVGAAATLGAIFRAPLTASMLMFELTQNHDIVLPVLAASGLAGLFAEILIHPRKQW